MDREQVRLARAGLTQVIEPADSMGVYAVKAWGPLRLLEIVQGSTPTQHDWLELTRSNPDDPHLLGLVKKNLGEAIARWRRRSRYLHPEPALTYIRGRGGQLLIPEDPAWPSALEDLGDTQPLALWTLGQGTIPDAEQVLALVGSREATQYGERTTDSLVRHARKLGLTIVSGGAYGIDAQAHRSALELPGATLSTFAVLAGGLDRLYPAGNEQLLRSIIETGMLISEMPPGMRPNKYRFLNRNRVIAALASTTIIVEARYRSGALNTANHAHGIDRNVGAVPGPFNVATSAGCHRLLRETPTLLIDQPADIEQFVTSVCVPQEVQSEQSSHQHDQLTTEEMLVYESLPIVHRTQIPKISSITGLALPQITGILSKLQRIDLAEQNPSGWRKIGTLRK